ncbi:MAG: DUF1992 domain-containing protein [Bacillota bacterium]|nr:MAG: hypothetical protein DIU70_13775 [Bacillota bacterium]
MDQSRRERPAEPGDRLSPYWTNPEPSPLAVKGYRDWVEEQIQEAMARGDFDNLPGKGKPLDLTENPFEKDWLVHHILKNASVAPEWIELRREIQADLAWLRDHPDHPGRAERIRETNRKIDRYNLLVPIPNLQYPRLTPATAPGARLAQAAGVEAPSSPAGAPRAETPGAQLPRAAGGGVQPSPEGSR